MFLLTLHSGYRPPRGAGEGLHVGPAKASTGQGLHMRKPLGAGFVVEKTIARQSAS